MLKHYSNIEFIEISGFVITEDNERVVKRVFDAIHHFCNNSTKFIFEIECIPEEVMQRFFAKFGSNIIELLVTESIPKAFAFIKESNVEKIVLYNGFDLFLNEMQFKRLKYFQIEMFDTQDLDALEVFIKRNKHNIKHLQNYYEITTDEEKARLLNIISNLSNLVELILRIDFDLNEKRIAKQLTRIANNCKQLKSIEIWFNITLNIEDMNELMAPLRQFKQLNRLAISLSFNENR